MKHESDTACVQMNHCLSSEALATVDSFGAFGSSLGRGLLHRDGIGQAM